MIYHSSHHIPSPLGQWGPSWLDVSAFAKQPDPSWFDYPSNPHPSARRRSYPRLEHSLASPSTSRSLHPHSRTRANPHSHPLRAQVAPPLSALPMLPISLPMPGLECESSFAPIPTSIYAASQHLPCPPRIPDRRCQRQRHPHLPRSFSMWCATRHYWHPSHFHTDHLHLLTISNFPTRTRIYHTRRTLDPRSESEHKMDRTTLLPLLLFLSDGPPRPYYEA